MQSKKNKGGRPEIYTLEFCLNEIKEFWQIILNDNKTKVLLWQDLTRNKPYSRQRISEWVKKFEDNEEFSDTIKKINDELESRLFKLGLSKLGNPAMAIFGLKNNHGWKDKSEMDVTTQGVQLVINCQSEADKKLIENL